MTIHDDLLDLLRFLSAREVEYLLVGGYAVAFYGFVRTTKDVDIFYRGESGNIQRLMAALGDFGIAAEAMDVREFEDPGSIVRVGFPPVMAEFINAISGVTFDEAWDTKVMGLYDDVRVAYISRDLLLKNKRASGRPRDLYDVDELGKLYDGGEDI